MPKALIKSDGYQALIKKIVREFEELEVFVKNRVAKGYWNVGKYIDEHLLAHKDRPEHATGFYEKLAEDTGRERTTLQWAVRFYRAYPICEFPHKLTWEHYKGLITVKDEKERKNLEEKIIRRDWDTRELRKHLSIKRRFAAPANNDNPVPQLTFTRGKLNACRIVPANKTLIHRGPLALDLGFRAQYAIPDGAPKLKENDTVEFVLGGENLSGVPRTNPFRVLRGVRKVEVAEEEIFTYKAGVERVIDGDTLLVSLDFGCTMSVSWKLRLRGIDCPEIDTEEGKRAKRFVEARLRGCEFIVVKTYRDRTDKFDRYLADVFYSQGETDAGKVAREGLFLNQELLNARLAQEYTALQ